jgi:hypothetical protein
MIMNIGSVSNNDSMNNFFKAVDAARQRNNVAFSQEKSFTATETEAKKQTNEADSLSSGGAYGNTAPYSSLSMQNVNRTSSPVTTRILGNFFDAYA